MVLLAVLNGATLALDYKDESRPIEGLPMPRRHADVRSGDDHRSDHCGRGQQRLSMKTDVAPATGLKTAPGY
jgi:hypothetical protein